MNEPQPADPQAQSPEPDDVAQFGSDRRSGLSLRTLGIVVGILLVIDVLAFFFVPPQNVKNPGEACSYPVCFVNGTLHLPRPEEVWVMGGAEPTTQLLAFQVSLTNSLITMIGLTVLVTALAILASRGRAAVPGFLQNFMEWVYESFSSFGHGMGGPAAGPYIPLFASFFVLILVFNWSGLVPPVGLVEELRAPTSDLNVTIGLALVAFVAFEAEGFRRLGVRGYLSKFFPLQEFRQGLGAGVIAMFVGITEFFLEFIKPVTLSMRLFGNIFGGEVALGVITGLSVALIPVAFYGLEVILNFVQALIFSVLTLMFIVLAVQSHDSAEGHVGEEAMEALEGTAHHSSATS